MLTLRIARPMSLPKRAQFQSIAVLVLLSALPASLPASLAAQELAKVTVTTAKIVKFVGQVSVTGTLVARNEVMVNPRVAGRTIMAVHADIGDQVQKGDLLADLDRKMLQVQADQARAVEQQSAAGLLQARAQVAVSASNLKQAKTNYQRDASLKRTGTISQARLDLSQTALSSAQASDRAAQEGVTVANARLEQAKIGVRLADLNLSYTRITAPVSGTVSARNANLGAIAAAGRNPMFQIVKDNKIELSSEVIETDIARLAQGDSAAVQVAGVGQITGKVRLVSPRVDPRTRLGNVRISLQPDPALRLGLFANGWIVTARRQSLGIPASAVLADAQSDFVLVVDKAGVVHKRRVKTGLIWHGMREIRSGLSKGETVLLRAGAFFRDGDRVSPVTAPQEPTK